MKQLCLYSIRITATHQPKGVITKVKLKRFFEEEKEVSVLEVIELIKKGEVVMTDHPSPSRVYTYKDMWHEHITTHPDLWISNNLDQLPRF